MGLLTGKKAIIFGVANERSIAWSISQKLHEAGAELAFTYAGEIFKGRVTPLAESLNSKIILPCDVTNDAEIDAVFDTLKKQWGSFDILVHSLAFANKDELKNEFLDTSREGFKMAMDISAYSLVSLTKKAVPLMEKAGGGSIMTMTYYGAEKVIPNYNVMGVAKAALEASVIYLAEDLGKRNIRVNAISAGPIKTLAAMGITGLNAMLNHVGAKAPLRRNTDQNDVAGTALYLASDLSSGVTGETIHVDCGFHIIGL